MIISKTPLRISFAGGGSDLSSFYSENGGAVVSTAINKFIYVTVNQKFDQGIRVSYSVTEEVEAVHQIRHVLVREALRFLELTGGIEITTVADIPSRGTGLGSSSSFTVGLLNALNAFKSRYVSREQLGADSCHIEIDICGEPIGKQDQYAAAFGGLNLIEFRRDGAVDVSPIICRKSTADQLESSLLLLYTGITRSASALLAQQSQDVANNHNKACAMRRMVELAYAVRDELQSDNLDAFGEILHENWELKKSLTKGISTSDIDDWYEAGRRAGAVGGKILGAGAGGFLMFFAPPEKHRSICRALPHLRPVSVGLERVGSQIVFYQ